MTIELTVTEVRAVAAGLEASDAAIELQISVVGCKLDACLEANYADCEDLAKAIKIYTVAHFADMGNNNKGAVTSQKWADGDQQQFADRGNATSSYWDTAIQLDSSGCVESAFSSKKVFAVTGRTSKYKDCPV